MRRLKRISFAALVAMAQLAISAGFASATTLEIGGVTQNKSVTLDASLKSGTSAVIVTTSGSFADTCNFSTLKGSTASPYTGAMVGGVVSTLAFSGCTHGTRVVNRGTISIAHAGGTNGTVRSTSALINVDSTTFGVTMECTTSDTHLGTLTGVSSGHATLHVNAVVNCGFFVPSARWLADYTFTSPTGLGVSA